MSDHSKFLAEQRWQEHNDQVIMSSDVPDAHILSDVQHLDEVLAQHEEARFEAWADSITDPYDDGDDD